jgi:hypothetical protein
VNRLFCAIAVFILLTGACLAQMPAPPASAISANDVSAMFLLPIKNGSPFEVGAGGQLSGSRFFNRHIGIELEGDYERASFSSFQDGGVRIGPVVRLGSNTKVQPFLEGLAGFSLVKATYLSSGDSFHGSGSVMGGGGLDFHLSGPWFARGQIDIQEDWTAHTTVGRVLVGISYRLRSR